MKKQNLFFLIALLLQLKVSYSQVEVWDWQGYSIGVNATGNAVCAMGAMPDVVLINSQYYMYYVARYNSVNAIYYATSPDMITWTVKDTIMTASSDTTNRIYDLGGPGVLKLSSGQYRLFYRTAQKATLPNEPLFHIRSMISSDGINFTHEAGVRVEIQPYLANSYFKSASHPSVYKDSNGNTKAIITGRDSSMNINSPAGLYTASSADEGLTWGNFAKLYDKCHDPIVIRDSSHIYHMYTSYLGSAHREAVSADGITWPTTPDSMLIQKGTTPLNEQTSAFIIADLGAAVKANGSIVLYSNYKPIGPGPWIDVAYYFPSATNGIADNTNENYFLIYPNPTSEFIEIIKDPGNTFSEYEIISPLGQQMISGSIPSSKIISLHELNNGIYLLRIFDPSKQKSVTKTLIKN